MRLAELGILALVVVFVGGMTYKHQEKIKENKKKALLFEITKQEDQEKEEFLELAYVETIDHDSDKETNTVFVTLDASTSFDGGNVADKLVTYVDVPDTKKPICITYEEDCDPTFGRNCECVEYFKDQCDNIIYEPMCAEYEKGCDYNKIERCECIENMTMPVEYVDLCEYTILPHDKRVEYLKRQMNFEDLTYAAEKEIFYSWSVTKGDVEIPKDKQDAPSFTLELGVGEYEFSCVITDPYGATDIASQSVIIQEEPNNQPEANIIVRKASMPEKKAVSKD